MKKRARRIAYDGVLTAVSLVLFIVEMQIPLPIPVPGVKLGLANVVTLFAMFALGPVDALAIAVARILLGSLFSGSVTALLYSLAGGALCYLVLLLLRKAVTKKQIFVCGVFGAMAHVTAQIAVATLMTGTAQIFIYLPVLILAAVFTGALTGLVAQFVLSRVEGLLSKR